MCGVHIGVLQSSTDRALPGAVGCLRSRACGVAVVVMEQQDKKQVSLVSYFIMCLCSLPVEGGCLLSGQGCWRGAYVTFYLISFDFYFRDIS